MNLYLDRYAYPHQLIATQPSVSLGLVVVIPCFNEPHLISTLESISECHQPCCDVEVIIIVNEPEQCPGVISCQNQKTYDEAINWVGKKDRKDRRYFVSYLRLPNKQAGVGWARKIGMDEAVRRFEMIKSEQGVIVSFDADSICEKNYLKAIEHHFNKYGHSPACSIRYEHPLEGTFPFEVYEGIIKYELFLLYYVDALRFAGFPYAYQTIGSSMAVRSSVYQKQGGMNRKKAGEDFYFLHKVIPLGGFTELNTTKVIPSPRPSDRVPFGTGKAITDWLASESKIYPAYHPKIFYDLKIFFDQIDQLYGIKTHGIEGFVDRMPKSIQSFLTNNNFAKHIMEINSYSASTRTFRDRFFRWMNGFKVLKYVHHARDHFYGTIDIGKASRWLLREYYQQQGLPSNDKDLLLVYRKIKAKEVGPSI